MYIVGSDLTPADGWNRWPRKASLFFSLSFLCICDCNIPETWHSVYYFSVGRGLVFPSLKIFWYTSLLYSSNISKIDVMFALLIPRQVLFWWPSLLARKNRQIRFYMSTSKMSGLKPSMSLHEERSLLNENFPQFQPHFPWYCLTCMYLFYSLGEF